MSNDFDDRIVSDISRCTIGDELLNIELKNHIVEVLTKRKQKKAACDHNSLVLACINSNVKESEVKLALKDLVEKNILSSKIYGERNVYNIVNSRVNTSEISEISENPEEKEHEVELEYGNVSLNSSELIQNDFYDFKMFTHNSLAELRSQIGMIKITEDSHKVDPTKSIIESKDAIIGLLREEIGFLRQENIDLRDIIRRNQSSETSENISSNDTVPILVQQLNDKQKTIETLLSSQQLRNVNYERKPLTANTIVKDNCLSNRNGQTISINHTDVNEHEKTLNRNTVNEKPLPVKKVFIVGDSIVNGVNPNRFKDCKNLNISVKPFGGSTSHMICLITSNR